ncbi:MAG TPA: hypothetical protein DEQ47_10780 [Solibacterales bacterium]|nr:hypothetical protein [Bryobacterales bacterium]
MTALAYDLGLRYLLLAAASLLAFGASLTHGFHFDDAALWVDPAITGHGWNWLQTRPLTWLTFRWNYLAAGSAPLGYHAVSLLLHVAVVVLLFLILREAIGAKAAWIAALIVAVHPVQAEAVAYVFSRGSLLSALLCLAAWWAWRRERAWLALACFGLALCAKEECAAFPLFLMWLDWWRARKLQHRAALSAMLVLSLAAGLHVLAATRAAAHSGAGFSADVTPLGYAAAQGYSILRYMALLVVPYGFSIDPELPSSKLLLGGAWLVLIGLVAAALRVYRRWPATGWWLGGLILLLPSSSIFPASDLAADHRLYLPMIAFAAGIGVALQPVRSWMLAAGALVLIGVSWTRMAVWSSDRALWSEAAARAPGKVRPLLQLSRAVEPGDALNLLEQARSLAPREPAVATEEGRVYLQLGRPAEALRAFGQALALDPGEPHALNNRGVALEALGQHAAARQDFERALRRAPCLSDARRNLRLPPCANSIER